jgi:hypothetical protein
VYRIADAAFLAEDPWSSLPAGQWQWDVLALYDAREGVRHHVPYSHTESHHGPRGPGRITFGPFYRRCRDTMTQVCCSMPNEDGLIQGPCQPIQNVQNLKLLVSSSLSQ